MFRDREEAGRRLAAELARFKDARPLVLALPRGGVPVGYEVAAALRAPLDLVLVRKVGAPDQPELAVGAVVDGEKPDYVVNEDVLRLLGLPKDYVEVEGRSELAEIERRRRLWLGGRPRLDISGRTAIVVDDGIATGATIRAAIKAVRRAKPKRIVLAVPVAPTSTLEDLAKEADEIVCLERHEPFYAIGMYYGDFPQLADNEVADLLERSAAIGGT